MFKGALHLHLTSVIIFLLIYLFKTILLVLNKNEQLEKLKSKTKVLEMIVSTLFLITGVYMLFEIPEIKNLLIIKIVLVLASIPVAVVAYKKSNKALAILSLVMIILSYGLAEMSKKQHSKASDASSIKSDEHISGKQIYTNDCSKCHGEDGAAGIAGAFDLSKSTSSDDEVMGVIKNGRGAMVGFGDAYNEEQLAALVEYLKTLRK